MVIDGKPAIESTEGIPYQSRPSWKIVTGCVTPSSLALTAKAPNYTKDGGVRCWRGVPAVRDGRRHHR